jgi:ABC-type sugar transport system substrate-binding protein
MKSPPSRKKPPDPTTAPARLLGLWLLLAAIPLGGCHKEAALAAKKPTVGAILMQQDQFFRMNEEGMKAAANARNVSLRIQNATGALDKEISLIDTFITQKVGAILVSPLSTQASIPALKRAHEAGIKIITYNNSITADFPVCNIASDQAALGASTGVAAREYVEQELGGRAKLALIGFASQLPEQGGARFNGFKQEIQKLPGVQIVAEQDAWTAPQAATTVSEILTKQPDVIWAANEGGTVGAVTAVRNAGKIGRVAVFGTDISKQLTDFLLADDNVLQAVTAQKPFEMGKTAVETAADVLAGKPVEKSKVLQGVLFTRDRPDEVRAYQRQLTGISQ